MRLHLAVRRLEVLDRSKAGGRRRPSPLRSADLREISCRICGLTRQATSRSCRGEPELKESAAASCRDRGQGSASGWSETVSKKRAHHERGRRPGSRGKPRVRCCRATSHSCSKIDREAMDFGIGRQDWRGRTGCCAELSRPRVRHGRGVLGRPGQLATSGLSRRGAGASTLMRTRIAPSVTR